MLTVLTWFWRQPGCRTTYTAEHVNIWAAMVRRNLSLPHRIACVTTERKGIDPSIEIITPPREFEEVRIPTWNGEKPSCFRRLSMFRRDAERWFGQRFVCMDLDCVVGRSLDPLFDRDDSLVLFKGTSGKRPYNGSMLLMTAGARPQVHEWFTPEKAVEAGQKFLGSDQAWLAHVLGWGEKTWDEKDGVFWFGGRYSLGTREIPRVLFFPGRTKPWNVTRDQYVTRHYREGE